MKIILFSLILFFSGCAVGFSDRGYYDRNHYLRHPHKDLIIVDKTNYHPKPFIHRNLHKQKHKRR